VPRRARLPGAGAHLRIILKALPGWAAGHTQALLACSSSPSSTPCAACAACTCACSSCSSQPVAANSFWSSGSPTSCSPITARPWQVASSCKMPSDSSAACFCIGLKAPPSSGTTPISSRPCSVSVPVLSKQMTSSWPATLMRSGLVT
jgi:hypothetical protein